MNNLDHLPALFWKVVSLSLRHWQHFAFEDGSEEIRADDLYVDSESTIHTSTYWVTGPLIGL